MPYAGVSLCYIRTMLKEDLLVPETIVKPQSFVGLMALYESNYLRLQQLIPDLERLDGYYRSRVAGDCDLHLEIIERSRYTVTLSLSYFFEDNGERIADPDMQVRVYLDGRLAEAMRLGGDHRHPGLRKLIRAHRHELDKRWRRNMVLNKWLEFLMDQGHLILER
jgi:uncharacterized protein YqiB (DUF1249 family)